MGLQEHRRKHKHTDTPGEARPQINCGLIKKTLLFFSWLANVLHELLLLLLELEPWGRWGTGQLLRGAALTCWAVMVG